MFSGFGSGGRSLTFDSGLPLPFFAAAASLPFSVPKLLDHAADDVLRPERLDALRHGRDIDDLVADHHAQFVIVEKREFHVRSLQLLIVVKCWSNSAGRIVALPARAMQAEAGCGMAAMWKEVAGAKGLEPSTSAVTGQRSNQLSYAPAGVERGT